MDDLFITLQAKTFFVLSIQLLITWLSARLTISKFRMLHYEGAPWVTSTENALGQPDLHIDFNHIKAGFYLLLFVDITVFLILLFWGIKQPLSISMIIFGVWSILTGIEMALCLISVDENLGTRVLAITATIVFGAFAYNVYSGMDFGFLGPILFLSLLALIVFNLIQLFVAIPRTSARFGAGIGVAVFTLYLLYDFNRLEKLQVAGVNDWPSAVNIAMSIYLDIINLFLDLLDFLSK